jgi:signal transduction histidine kinase
MLSPRPVNEAHRLSALRQCGILDTEAEPLFDGIVTLARTLFDTPMANVSLVDSDRQWFKACCGTDQRETPRDHAFCGFAVMDDSPLVTGDPWVRFYVGAPLILADGFRVGALCVVDRAPRPAPPRYKVQALEALATLTARELDRRRQGQGPASAATRAATSADRAKQDFLSLISHELLTPLNAISGYSQLIAEGQMPDNAVEYAQAIGDASEHLHALIRQVLRFSQLERGELELFERAVDPAAVIRRAVSAMRMTPGHGDCRLLDLPAPNLPPATLDPEQMHHALLNLIGNALQAGGSRVEVSAEIAANGDLMITIADDGGGVAEETRGGAMDGFAIGEPVLTRRRGGLGLGLPLSARIVEAHGGRLTLDSPAAGAGTRACIRLPAWRLAGRDRDRKKASQAGSSAA